MKAQRALTEVEAELSQNRTSGMLDVGRLLNEATPPTLSRMGVETVLVANVAFCSERSFLRIVANGVRAPKRRRRR
jgi:hypothetical protein